MRRTEPENQTELEKLLIEALLNSCGPCCSHEGCRKKNSKAYDKGYAEAKKYLPLPFNAGDKPPQVGIDLPVMPGTAKEN